MLYDVIQHFLLIFSLLLNASVADQDSLSILPFEPHRSTAVRAKYSVLAASVDHGVKLFHAFHGINA